MNELAKQGLDQYFSDFKQYHTLILIIFLVVIALIQILQSVYITLRIEKFKNDLKKSEIKFSRFNELQVTALRKIYHLLVNFQAHNNILFSSEINSAGHIKYRNRIKEWIKSYVECVNEFSREKLLLTSDIKTLFTKTLSDFEEIKNILITQANDLDYSEMEHSGNWNSLYSYEENELEIISNKIEYIKKRSSSQNSDRHIRQLREEIERLFEKMN